VLCSTATVPHLFEKRRPKNFRQNFVLVVSVARITLSVTIQKTGRAVVCKQAYTTALPIFIILADSCYSRKKSKQSFVLRSISALICRQSAIIKVTKFWRQNAVVGVHRVKSPTMDSTKTYSHCRAFRDVRLMPYFHNKTTFCLSLEAYRMPTELQ
jgi:hypothetical protein